jgi:hypothetical protein
MSLVAAFRAGRTWMFRGRIEEAGATAILLTSLTAKRPTKNAPVSRGVSYSAYFL